MKKIIKVVLVLSAVCSMPVLAADVVGKIMKIRSTTSTHPDADSKSKMLLSLGVTLEGDCKWLSVGADENLFISTALSAEAKEQEIRIWYSTETCEAFTVELR